MGRYRLVRASIAVVVAIVVMAATGFSDEPSGARGNYWEKRTKLAPGVKYIRINDPRGPHRIGYLSINPAKPSTIDVVLGTEELPAPETTSSMAQRSGALAAINGDYSRPSGRPVFVFAQDGVLVQTPELWGRNFAMREDEGGAYIGHPKVALKLKDHAAGTKVPIDKANEGPPEYEQVALITPDGGSEERPPANACAARLYDTGSPEIILGDHPGVATGYVVDKVRCSEKRMRRRGGVVLAAPVGGPRAEVVTSLEVGGERSLKWTLGWDGVVDAVGGNPTLIEDGEIVKDNVEGEGSFFERHPRTGVGITAEGKILLVTVDGRQPGYSVGMRLKRFARLFEDLDATWALNADGGGSTTMVVDDSVRNRPSDGSERAVSSAIIVLPGSDLGEAGIGSPRPAFEDAATGSFWDAAVADPASTGGLADALRRKGLALPGWMHRAAQEFAVNRGLLDRALSGSP